MRQLRHLDNMDLRLGTKDAGTFGCCNPNQIENTFLKIDYTFTITIAQENKDLGCNFETRVVVSPVKDLINAAKIRNRAFFDRLGDYFPFLP